jgi:hypothetical protein
MAIIERRSRWLRLVMAIATVALLLAACAGSASQLAPVDGGVDTGAEQPAPGASAAPAAPAGGDSGGLVPDEDGNAAPALRDDLKVVYTGSLQLVVDDLQAALAKAKAAVLATGGYVGASQESNDGEQSVATITYRIPATRWEDAIADLRGLATRVVFEQTQATEVGSQIVDLEARIRNLRASEASLQEIAASAGKISDLLEVEAQLTQVRGQIEQLDAQRAQLEDQVAYGTLVTTFGLEEVAVQQQAQGWDPREDVDAATATLIGAGQALVSAGIWFGIVWLPVILVLIVFVVIGRWAFRRWGPRGGASAGGAGAVPGWGGEG